MSKCKFDKRRTCLESYMDDAPLGIGTKQCYTCPLGDGPEHKEKTVITLEDLVTKGFAKRHLVNGCVEYGLTEKGLRLVKPHE